MKKDTRRRTKGIPQKMITLVVTRDEYEIIRKRFNATTYRYLSDYMRAQLQQQPVSCRYRNESLDEFLPIAIAIKDELNACAQYFREGIAKLYQIQDNAQLRGNLEYFEATEFTLQQKITEIKSLLIKIHEKCLSK